MKEIGDNAAWQKGKHSFGFGGDFSHVNTTESFPLFYPFEADFGCLFTIQCPFSLQAGAPQVLFFERFQAPNFTEPTFNPSVFQGQRIPNAVRQQAQGKSPIIMAGSIFKPVASHGPSFPESWPALPI